MEWALWGLEYMAKARSAIHDDFNEAMGELRGYTGAHRASWYSSCKNIITTLYHFSMEFVGDTHIPSERFASPEIFENELTNYRAWVQTMAEELDREDQKYQADNKVDGPPFLVTVARRQVGSTAAAIDYVASKKSQTPSANPMEADVDLVLGLARRFHESVLSLKDHPHNGTVFIIKDEWDCQYLFQAILAAYIPDVRNEEWNPSVAGSSARCEFYLKPLRALVELKYVRKATDAKKIKSELATDFLDYGKNPQVDHVICLVYDPGHALKNPAAVQADLSGPKHGLARVDVVISPPRS
ncbi:hypothetical protein [Mesorhizobium sp. M0619]|uniref:PD-(D/E)XK nuclease domain-containing protein n=1 Tax=unclassified Mesorhizobium TaxID=325217 RepID=UPI003339A805